MQGRQIIDLLELRRMHFRARAANASAANASVTTGMDAASVSFAQVL
jgi:hypothetical protein